MMDARYAAHREQLTERMRELMARRDHNEQELRELMGERHADIVDESTDLLSAATLESLSESELVELKAIMAALDRYDAGVYGSCVGCGEDIGEARLTVLPWTPMCIDCAQEAERRARQYAPGAR